MKITVDNISDFEKYLGHNAVLDKGYKMMLSNVKMGLYKKTPDAKKILDEWLEKANKMIESLEPSTPESNRRRVKRKNGKRNGDSSIARGKKLYKRGATNKAKKAKADADAAKKAAKEAEKAAKKAQKEAEKAKKAEEKKKKAEEKKAAKTDNKPKKSAYKVAPRWWKCLDSFVKMAGKTKDTWRIQNFLDDLQTYFNAKLQQQTPFIELIREIQDKVFPYANKDRNKTKKQALPEWKDLVNKCKEAKRTISINKDKGEEREWKSESLSGTSRRRKGRKKAGKKRRVKY